MKKIKDSTTEQQILEAAEKLFYERGFAMTHTTDIAREVGCNQALVHYYFRTKEKLFESFFKNKVQLFISAFLTAGNNEETFEGKLTRKIEAHFDILRKNPRLPFLLFNEISVNPQRVESFRANLGNMPQLLLKAFDDEIEAEAKEGRIRRIHAIDLILSIISMNAIMFIANPIIKALTDADEKEYERMLGRRRKENVDAILRSLRP